MSAFAQNREPFYFPGSKSTSGRNPFPKRESQKNKSRIRGVFSTPKYDHQFTTKSPQSTTNSPPKNATAVMDI
jgi:hypothetical protein